MPSGWPASRGSRSSTCSSAPTTRSRPSSSAPSSGRCRSTTPTSACGCSTTDAANGCANSAGQLGANYLTRTGNAHAKAGNINNGLLHVASLDQPPDFVAILDADFVPMPNFLDRTLPLFRDQDVGVVQTPQHFINPDPLQSNLAATRVWPDEQRYFFDVVMASKDAWGAAFCCGTSSVIRFPALWSIGGLPTGSVTEDYLLTLRLKAEGYRTVYLNERLSLGLAPEGLKEYITQRSRWALGFAQICRGPLGPLRPGNGLTLIDRISLIDTFLYWFASYAFRMLRNHHPDPVLAARRALGAGRRRHHARLLLPELHGADHHHGLDVAEPHRAGDVRCLPAARCVRHPEGHDHRPVLAKGP